MTFHKNKAGWGRAHEHLGRRVSVLSERRRGRDGHQRRGRRGGVRDIGGNIVLNERTTL